MINDKDEIKSSGGGIFGTPVWPGPDTDPPVTQPAVEDAVAESEEQDPEGMPKGEPNVRLSKKRESEALPKGLLNIGMHSGILIPTKKTQLAGFYVEAPSLLINQFPQYKWVKQKDGTKPVQ